MSNRSQPDRRSVCQQRRGGGSEWDGLLDGARDEATAGGPVKQGAEDLVGLRQDAEIETTLQVTPEMDEALEPEAAFLYPPEEDIGPLVDGTRASPLLASYSVGQVVAESLGDGLEPVDFKLISIFALEGVHEAADLRDGH